MNPSKAKGTKWESELVGYLNAHGFPYAERRALAGGSDKGDVSGIPGVIWEAKNCKTITLAEWADETETERRNANATLGILVVKRRRRPTADAYCVVPLWQLTQLLEGNIDASASRNIPEQETQ